MTAVGPVDEESFTKGQGKKEFANEGDWFAVYSFQGNHYQWKWNANTEYWYWFAGQGKGWVKGNKDEAGMKKCQSQAEQRDKWMKDQEEKRKSKGKGKKEEGQSKGKGSDEVIEIKDDDEPTSYQ